MAAPRPFAIKAAVQSTTVDFAHFQRRIHSLRREGGVQRISVSMGIIRPG